MVTPAERTNGIEDSRAPHHLSDFFDAVDPDAADAKQEDQYAAAELKRRHERTAIMIRKAQEQLL